MWKLGLAVVSLGLVATGCGGYVDGSEEYSEDLSAVDGVEEVDSLGAEGAVCANPEGVNYSMAALAVATANELKRWNTVVDYTYVRKYNYSMAGWQEVLDLSTTGRNLCMANGGCTNIQSILDLQKKEFSGLVKFPNGATLQSDVLAQRLVANYKAQQTCNGQPKNLCPAEAHKLTFIEAKPGECELDFFYKATKAGSDTLPLSNPSLLKNELITFGSLAGNEFLKFDAPPDKPSTVKIDPGGNTIPGNTGSSGGCADLDGANFVFSSASKPITAGAACKINTGDACTPKKFVLAAGTTNMYWCK